jgi:hypothetical protein
VTDHHSESRGVFWRILIMQFVKIGDQFINLDWVSTVEVAGERVKVALPAVNGAARPVVPRFVELEGADAETFLLLLAGRIGPPGPERTPAALPEPMLPSPAGTRPPPGLASVGSAGLDGAAANGAVAEVAPAS